jgi:hypothetical protein
MAVAESSQDDKPTGRWGALLKGLCFLALLSQPSRDLCGWVLLHPSHIGGCGWHVQQVSGITPAGADS